MSGRLLGGKLAIALLACVVIVAASVELSAHRHYREAVVRGPGVTGVARLSDYFDGIKGTANDTNVYFIEPAASAGDQAGGGGATMLVLGGSHANEPVGTLTSVVLVENAQVDVGRLIIIPHDNRSASTCTQPTGAYPLYYEIRTPWGARRFRMGDRVSNPLDQWPDPDVYVHYPSRQLLSYVDIRNVNRCWPGRADGTLTERTGYALMEVIRAEKVDLVIDMHGAELLYPVTNCIVAHQRSQIIAVMASINLTGSEFEIHTEPSPVGFHGLSHREIGDHSGALPMLMETPDPFLDQPTGPKTEDLLLNGRDELLLSLAKKGLLFTDYDETGKTMELRVGRHISSIVGIAEVWTSMNPTKPLAIRAPRFADLTSSSVGNYLLNPNEAGPQDVYYE